VSSRKEGDAHEAARAVSGRSRAPERSDPQNAVGPAESPGPDPTPPPNTFFSLGFGGTITLGFDNPICNARGYDFDIGVVEITQEPYPPEIAYST
jgi:hypothetical protein